MDNGNDEEEVSEDVLDMYYQLRGIFEDPVLAEEMLASLQVKIKSTPYKLDVNALTNADKKRLMLLIKKGVGVSLLLEALTFNGCNQCKYIIHKEDRVHNRFCELLGQPTVMVLFKKQIKCGFFKKRSGGVRRKPDLSVDKELM